MHLINSIHLKKNYTININSSHNHNFTQIVFNILVKKIYGNSFFLLLRYVTSSQAIAYGLAA